MSETHTPRSEEADAPAATRGSTDDRDAPLLPSPSDQHVARDPTAHCGCCRACASRVSALLDRHDLKRDVSPPRRAFLRLCLIVLAVMQPLTAATNVAAFVYGVLEFNHLFEALHPTPFADSDDFEPFLFGCAWALLLPLLNFVLWYIPLYNVCRRSPDPLPDGDNEAGGADVAAAVADAVADAPMWSDWHRPPVWSWVERDVLAPINAAMDEGDLKLRIEQHVPTKLSLRRRVFATVAQAGIGAAMASCVVGATGPKVLGAGGVLYAVEWHRRVVHWTVLSGETARAEPFFYKVAAVSIASVGMWTLQWLLLALLFVRVARGLAHSRCIAPTVVGIVTFASLVAVMVLGLFTTSAIPSGGRTPNALPSRGLCFRNSCGETIRVGQIGGSTGLPCSPSCLPGTVCNPADGFCYFDLKLSDTELFLGPGGEYCHPFEFAPVTTTVHPITGTVHPLVQWSGALYASGGCNGGACATAICDGCAAYQGPVGPVTQAEMTLAPNAKDYYDVTIINGANFPLSVTPLSPNGKFAPDPNTPAAYHCRAPGAPAADRDTPGASWVFQQPSTLSNRSFLPLVSFDAGATSCTHDGDCSQGQTCGTAMATLHGEKPLNYVHDSVCGAVIGVWSRDELCGWTDAIDFGGCKTQLTAPVTEQIGNIEQLFQCNPPFKQSCFQQGVNEACCGCSVWSEFVPVHTANCTKHNPLWTEYAMPHIEVLKRGCPTCYTYPYDDATSLFTCWSNATHNDNSYLMEWCPGGTSVTTT